MIKSTRDENPSLDRGLQEAAWEPRTRAALQRVRRAVTDRDGESSCVTQHEFFMRSAIELSMSNPERPFAALIIDRKTGEFLSTGTNRVQEHSIWHAEIDALHQLDLPSVEPASLALYTTAEPCPMCFSAILWTGIGEVVYGTSIATLVQIGWRQIPIGSREILSRTTDFECEVISSILREETDALFAVGPPRVIDGTESRLLRSGR